MIRGRIWCWSWIISSAHGIDKFYNCCFSTSDCSHISCFRHGIAFISALLHRVSDPLRNTGCRLALAVLQCKCCYIIDKFHIAINSVQCSAALQGYFKREHFFLVSASGDLFGNRQAAVLNWCIGQCNVIGLVFLVIFSTGTSLPSFQRFFFHNIVTIFHFSIRNAFWRKILKRRRPVIFRIQFYAAVELHFFTARITYAVEIHVHVVWVSFFGPFFSYFYRHIGIFHTNHDWTVRCNTAAALGNIVTDNKLCLRWRQFLVFLTQLSM